MIDKCVNDLVSFLFLFYDFLLTIDPTWHGRALPPANLKPVFDSVGHVITRRWHRPHSLGLTMWSATFDSSAPQHGHDGSLSQIWVLMRSFSHECVCSGDTWTFVEPHIKREQLFVDPGSSDEPQRASSEES